MSKEIEIFAKDGKGGGKVLEYTLSNNIEEIAEAAIRRAGVIVPYLYEAEWELNHRLSESVKDLMNDNNANYSMTTYEDALRHIIINKRSGDKWYIYGGIVFEGKFYSHDEYDEYIRGRNFSDSKNRGSINGYDNVSWGTSIEEVKYLYADLTEITSTENEKSRIRYFLQEFAGGSLISHRAFYFLDEKLYEVRVFFNGIDKTTERVLLNKFIEKYGNFDDMRENKYALDSSGKQYIHDISTVRFYSPELTIIINIESTIEQSSGAVIKHENIYNYFHPIIAGKIQKDSARKKTDGINL
jgi:hypothetical protein